MATQWGNNNNYYYYYYYGTPQKWNFSRKQSNLKLGNAKTISPQKIDVTSQYKFSAAGTYNNIIILGLSEVLKS